ncbi:MAG TPA: aminopeptidase [Clostridiaceae bacterium]|jgi:aminopeptidase|nr:aminopeptidase [Clostridiaceae bacterium]
MDRHLLKKYAEVIVGIGVNVQAGDNVLVNVGTESLELSRAVVRECWRRGARNVITLINDDDIVLARYEEGRDDVFDVFPDFEVEYIESMMKEKYHRIALRAPSLDLLGHIDQGKIQRSQKAANIALKPISKYMDAGDIKWAVAASPSVRWAKKLFPNCSEEDALNALWDQIVSICRIDADDPVAAWAEHDSHLKANERWLNERNFEYLHYEGPDTDLIVQLADRHKWLGGSSVTPDGVKYMPNIPTEEIFTTPHADRCTGRVKATKPLVVMGKIVEDFSFTFEDGRCVDFDARLNGDVIETLLGMDEGARRLGEIALVPHSSPVSQSGLLFHSTLYDENASCHFALGKAYAEAIRGGNTMSEEARRELGANDSMIHIDFMVGGPELQVTGYRKDGVSVPVLVDGEWAIDPSAS